ncbi:MAG TPA: hypothetical protein VK530_05855 [Candidatus Acidoferrum sp.]|nr:hypothetical protein [Candidatus Acidoferrum sp.]
MNAEKISPGVGWYWLAAALICGGLLAPVAIFLPLFRSGPLIQFAVPGTNAVALKAGEYVLWHDHTTVFQGTTYASPSNLPAGVMTRMLSQADGKFIPMSSGFTSTLSSGNSARRSVGKFSVSTAGDYVIEVSGQFAPQVFSLRPAQFSKVFGGILVLLFVESVAWIGGPLIILVVLLKRSRAKQEQRLGVR